MRDWWFIREFEQTTRNPGNANVTSLSACLDSQKLRLHLRFQVAGCLLKVANWLVGSRNPGDVYQRACAVETLDGLRLAAAVSPSERTT